jgi:ribA/ribD-fused uncharacterized protein
MDGVGAERRATEGGANETASLGRRRMETAAARHRRRSMIVGTSIIRFDGEERWLSNFHPARVMAEGQIWPTVEHAYQAVKLVRKVDRDLLHDLALPPAGAKRWVRGKVIQKDWDAKRTLVMRGLLAQKFAYPDLRRKLVETHPYRIIEGNDWNDFYWGVCRGEGQNMLGRMLMDLREELRAIAR